MLQLIHVSFIIYEFYVLLYKYTTLKHQLFFNRSHKGLSFMSLNDIDSSCKLNDKQIHKS